MEQKNKLQNILIILSHIVGRMGSGIFYFGIGLMILRETGSASTFGFSLVIGPLVSLILLPFTGSIVDRFHHKKIVVLGQLGSIFGIALFWMGLHYTDASRILLIYFLFTILSVTDLFLDTTYSASLVSMVPKENLQRMMSIKYLISTAVSIVSPLFGAILYQVLTFEQLVLVEIGSEILTLILVLGINFYLYRDNKEEKAEEESVSMWKMFREGLTYTGQNRLLRYTFISGIVLNLLVPVVQIGLPYLQIQIFRFTDTEYGIVQMSLSLGLLASGMLLSGIKEFKNPLSLSWRMIFLFFSAVFVYGILVLWEPGHFIQFYGLAGITFSAGFVLSFINIPIRVWMTKEIPQNMQGRIFNLLGTASQLLMPIGTVIVSTLLDLGIRVEIIFFCGGILGTMINWLIPGLLKVNLQTNTQMQ